MISSHSREATRAYANDVAESAYTPDPAAEIDNEAEELAEDFFWFAKNHIPTSKMSIPWNEMKLVIEAAGLWGITVRQKEKANMAGQAWEMLGRVIRLLLSAKNLNAQVHALAFAAGLDQLNGKKSQAEIARELGCTRALISHYVVGWADVLDLSITKFRKSENSRETYKESRSWLRRKWTEN
jgi:hypothetical protein